MSIISKNKISEILSKLSSRLNGFSFKMIDDEPYYKYKNNEYQPFCTGGGGGYSDIFEILYDGVSNSYTSINSYEGIICLFFREDTVQNINSNTSITLTVKCEDGRTYSESKSSYHSFNIPNKDGSRYFQTLMYFQPNILPGFTFELAKIAKITRFVVIGIKLNEEVRFKPSRYSSPSTSTSVINYPNMSDIVDYFIDPDSKMVYYRFAGLPETSLRGVYEYGNQSVYSGIGVESSASMIIFIGRSPWNQNDDKKPHKIENLKYNDKDFDFVLTNSNEYAEYIFGIHVGYHVNDTISFNTLYPKTIIGQGFINGNAISIMYTYGNMISYDQYANP